MHAAGGVYSIVGTSSMIIKRPPLVVKERRSRGPKLQLSPVRTIVERNRECYDG